MAERRRRRAAPRGARARAHAPGERGERARRRRRERLEARRGDPEKLRFADGARAAEAQPLPPASPAALGEARGVAQNRFLADGVAIPTDGMTKATDTIPAEPMCFSKCDSFCDQNCQQTTCTFNCKTDSFLTCP